MALTASGAFRDFADNLKLTELQRETVRSRLNTIDSRLNARFPIKGNLSLYKTKLIGSAQRETMIRPPDDVDILAVFYGQDWPEWRGDSQRFLYRVKDALDEGGATVAGARGQAVRIFYKSGPQADVAPVFPRSLGGYWLPKGDGSYIATDPDHHASYTTRRNSELDFRLKPFVRMLKAWNRAHSARLKSFHLEVMVSRIFSSIGNNSRKASEMFFRNAEHYLHSTDPAGHGGDLAARLSYGQERSVIQSFRSARERAERALEAEADGDPEEAIRLWRITYGDSLFPAYG